MVISQYIGRRERENAGETASQLLNFSAIFSLAVAALVLAGKEMLLSLLFGRVEPEVMEACVTYLEISAYSYPALAIYNAGAALQRSMGRTKTTMYISVLANIINIFGDFVGVFVLGAGVAGVAMGPVFITVIGQCVGAGDLEAAEYYFKKLGKYTLAVSIGWNLIILALTPLVLEFYVLEPETKQLVLLLVFIHNVFNAGAFPYSGAFSNGLRAAGDVRFTMKVSLASTIGGRLFLSYVLGVVMDIGVVGLAWAMAADWTIRAFLFLWRERTGKWREFQAI